MLKLELTTHAMQIASARGHSQLISTGHHQAAVDGIPEYAESAHQASAGLSGKDAVTARSNFEAARVYSSSCMTQSAEAHLVSEA